MSTPTTPERPAGSRGRHPMTVWGTILLICAAGLAATYFPFATAPPPKHIVIATGGKSGEYYPLGMKYAEELAKEGITVEVRETKGSPENLALLEDDSSGVSVAIVQSGVAKANDWEHVQILGSLF